MPATARDLRLAVCPMMAYEDPAAAIDWLTRVFGFREQTDQRYTEPDGTISHAQMEAGDGVVMLAAPTPDYQSPKHHAATCDAAAKWSSVPWIINGVQVQVDDVDALFERVRDAGVEVLSDVVDAPYGRLFRVADLEGQRWMFIQPT